MRFIIIQHAKFLCLCGQISRWCSGVQILCDICAHFGCYLYSVKCSWIIIPVTAPLEIFEITKRKKILKTSLFNEKWTLTTAVEESLHTNAKYVPLGCALGYALQIEGILVKRQPAGQLCLCLQRANVLTLLVHTLLNLTNAYKHWSTKTVKNRPSSGGGRKLCS